MKLEFWIGLSVVLLSGPMAWSQSFDKIPEVTLSHQDSDLETKCNSFKKPIHWKVCITNTLNSSNPDVIYFLHGLNGSAKRWRTDHATLKKQVRLIWQRQGFEAPRVVVISLGSKWFLIDGFLREFKETLLPYVEEKILQGRVGKRYLWGNSMGGFNALQLIMNWPQGFKKAVIVNPFIPYCLPYNGFFENLNCAFKHEYTINGWVNLFVMDLVKQSFPTPDDWAQVDPFIFGQNTLGSHSPKIFLTCGTKDVFGFFGSNRDFAEFAESLGVDLEWHPTALAHGEFEPEKVAEFLMP